MDTLQHRLKRYHQPSPLPDRLRDSLEEGIQQRSIAHAASVLLAHGKAESENGDWSQKPDVVVDSKKCGRGDGDYFRDLIQETDNIIANLRDRAGY